MTQKKTAKYLKIALPSKMYFVYILAREKEWNMAKNKNSHPKRCIYELFVYLPYLEVYPNASDMNKLYDIPPASKRFAKVKWNG
jgi:hypothetical protein